MTGPDRIWICRHFGEYGPFYPTAVEAEGEHGGIALEYIRRDPAVLAELPEVQALIRQAVEAEREAWQSMSMVDFANQMTTRSIAAIRKRGEG